MQKELFNEESILYFTETLRKNHWTYLYSLSDPNQAYSYFLDTFSGMYSHYYPVKQMIVKLK